MVENSCDSPRPVEDNVSEIEACDSREPVFGLVVENSSHVENSCDSPRPVEDNVSEIEACDSREPVFGLVVENSSHVENSCDSPRPVEDNVSEIEACDSREPVFGLVVENSSHVENSCDSPRPVEDNVSEIEACDSREPVFGLVVENSSHILPLDLIDSESSDECDYEVESPSLNQVHQSEDSNQPYTNEENTEEISEKVGRWTFSSVRCSEKKIENTVRISKASKHDLGHCKPSDLEKERLQIHSESQRLIREVDMQLPIHRPKQFKCFSEFRQSLKGGALSGTKNCESLSQNSSLPDCCNKLQATAEQPTQGDTEEDNLDIKPLILQGCSVDNPLQPVDIDHTISEPTASSSDVRSSLTLKNESNKLASLLPSLISRHSISDNNEEMFIDLGESVTVSKPSVTPADQLLARLRKHLSVPDEKAVVHGPIKYSIITKVQSNDSEREELQVETVTHQSSKSSSTTLSVSRKQWLEHRKNLEEKMRQKRLQQYEMRLKEEGICGSKRPPTENSEEALNSDEEWSEGDADDSALSEDSSSTTEEEDEEESSNEEGDEEEDEDDDDVLVSKKSSNRRACLFADDEAEESETDEGSLGGDEVQQISTAKQPVNSNQKDSYNKVSTTNFKVVDSEKNINKFYSLQRQCSQFDDFTDLPEDGVGFANFSSCSNFSLSHPQRRQQGSLGPGDVDLFASEYSSILDRTMNPRSILASTRLDATTLGDENKSRFTRDSSSHSQWNNTPYELLYSQKPNSQLPSRSQSVIQESADDSSALLDTNINHISSQDTVLLSQEPSQQTCDVDPTLILCERPELSVHSQVGHENRRHLFGGSVFDQSQASIGFSTEALHQNNTLDSQIHHEKRRNLFAGSTCDSTEGFTDLSTKSVEGNDNPDSQITHENRRNLFCGSICEQSQSLLSEVANPTETIDSQAYHVNRHNLFSGSLCDQSKAFMDLPIKPVAENDSQAFHENRRNLFGGSICDQSQPLMNFTNKSVEDNENPDSQMHHDNRRNLFSGSLCAQSQSFMDSAIKSTRENCSLDSQVHHENRRNLFSGSVCDQSQALMDEATKLTEDSQAHHENRRNLFGGSLCDQSQMFTDSNAKAIEENGDIDVQDSVPTTQNASRRRVLILDDDDVEEEHEEREKTDSSSNTGSYSHIQNSPLKFQSFQSESNIMKTIENTDFLEESIEDENQEDDDEKLEVDNYDDDSEKENDEGSSDSDATNSNADDDDTDNEPSEVEEEGEEKEEDENETDYHNVDEDDEEEVQRLTLKSNEVKKKKKFRMNNFVDEEAELSGDENERAYYMDDEDELDLDDADEEFADLIDENDSDIPSAGRLRRQLERVHHRLQTDQDIREIRYLKELFFEDGDLHAEDGRVRQRRFRWRGLDTDDPFAEQLNVDDGDENSSDEGDNPATVPFGPLDRWLHGPLNSKVDSSNENKNSNQSTGNPDLDSDSVHQSSNHHSNENHNDTLSGSDGEDEEENLDNNSNSVTNTYGISSTAVFSLGRKAVLKTQAKLKTQIIVRNKLPVNRGKAVKSSPIIKNPIISNFLKPKSPKKLADGTVSITTTTTIDNINGNDDEDIIDKNVTVTDSDNSNMSDNCYKPVAPIKRKLDDNDDDHINRDVKFQMVRHGSLLSRPIGSFFPGYKLELPKKKQPTFTGDFDINPPTSENNRRGQSHLLGLRNKVGLSCFSIVTSDIKHERIDSSDDIPANQTSVIGSSSAVNVKHKRPVDVIKHHSVLLSPPSLKRRRSTSVFTALL
ncbi:unnamed protein product [Heterobilharzia americana]|nr:unnamed protein product [Heterobilharzia americana]